MTGTEPENGASTRPGLARSLFRVSLPRWRGGQYSLSKLFFNFYFLAMGSFIAIAIVADFIITTAQQGITDDYSRRFMRGTITLIEDELHRHPRRQWAEQIKVIDEKFYYRLGIVERRSLDSRLASAQIDKLDSGDIAISHDRELIYFCTEFNCIGRALLIKYFINPFIKFKNDIHTLVTLHFYHSVITKSNLCWCTAFECEGIVCYHHIRCKGTVLFCVFDFEQHKPVNTNWCTNQWSFNSFTSRLF